MKLIMGVTTLTDFITGVKISEIVPFTNFPSTIFITNVIKSTIVITVSITGVIEDVMVS